MLCRFYRAAIVLLLGTTLSTLAGEFKAELVQSVAGMTMNGTMYMKDSKTRMEISMAGQSAITIVDPSAGTAMVLMPAQKMAMKMQMTSDNAGWSDSEESLKKAGATRVKIGEATLGGYECEKYTISFADDTKGSIVQWFSPALGTAVRIEYSGPQGTVIYELQNILQEPVADSLFVVPADYQVLDPAAMGIPAGMLPTGK